MVVVKAVCWGFLLSEVNNIGRVINEYDNTESSKDSINTNEYFINLLRNVSKAVFALLKK